MNKEEEADQERVIETLEERLEAHDSSRRDVLDKLHEICEELRAEIDKLEDRISKELEEKFISEDNRLQAALNELRGSSTASALQKAKAELLVKQSYELIEDKAVKKTAVEEVEDEVSKHNFTSLYELKTERYTITDTLDARKPTNVRVTGLAGGNVSVQFACLNTDEERVLSMYSVKYRCLFYKKKSGEGEEDQKKEEHPLNKACDCYVFAPNVFEAEATHCIRVKAIIEGKESEWSDEAEFAVPEFRECCAWKKCPGDISNGLRYTVGEANPRVVVKSDPTAGVLNGEARQNVRNGMRIGRGNEIGCCTVICNTSIPLNAVTAWTIKILKSKDNDGGSIYIGLAPSDIDQTKYNYFRCGWYFDCYSSTLKSGPPHDYKYNEYGPKRGNGQYVHTGDSVGVVIDATKGELSFILNGVSHGIAYEGIPLNKPLVPCVILGNNADSVELDTSEVKENVDSSIPILSSITLGTVTWNSITISWDAVEGASLYQIEVDGNKFWKTSATSTFTQRNLLPETEHTFRVRPVRGGSVGEWSDIMKVRVLSVPDFSECVWKECPDFVEAKRRYSLDEGNPRIAVMTSSAWSNYTVIGDIALPMNKITSWNTRVLKSKNNDGGGLYIGVAPFDIDFNRSTNCEKCGWYFRCFDSVLCSGPPHYYRHRTYGPRKENNGRYIHEKDTIGVVMDATKGELSFTVCGVSYGVAYERIPLNKPLVPCALLEKSGDSVELSISGAKESVDGSIPVASNVAPKNILWDSIAISWDAVEGVSLYQIEVDGNKFWKTSATSTFTQRNLLPETEHTFRVRPVRGGSVGEWCDFVKVRTKGTPEFSECVWKGCPDDENKNYNVDETNHRIATMVNVVWSSCPIVGSAPLPVGSVAAWSVKIVKSKSNNGNDIHVGVAPFDIGPNGIGNRDKCGWYFECHILTLYSGPPHNIWNRAYGPRREKPDPYIRDGDVVGVVMDTKKGDLSFVVDGVDYGVAYEGIPLDKPLVPCVLLKHKGDSVELII